MFERFTDRARAVVLAAKTTAQERGDDEIHLVHMLYGLAASDGVAARALTALGVDAAAVERELGRARATGGAPGTGAADEGDDDAEALAAIGIDLDEIRRRIEESFGPGALGRVPLTPKGPLNWTGGRFRIDDQAKLSLALSVREARAMRHSYIGTEHLLLGVLRAAKHSPQGEFAAVTLPDLGLDLATAHDRALTEVLQILGAQPPRR
ncbi:MAG TPA: Clp protease N-terminal domain-containing protein [Solirubrobacteraceae bacterium]|jgi:ATP-dependent Clp protease ATP-binding subunit ClpA|nr:Clp protease N-terminal domain-containing protein [Solirubrobacteraceae bacterium]